MISQYNTSADCITDAWINENGLLCSHLQLMLHSIEIEKKKKKIVALFIILHLVLIVISYSRSSVNNYV